jgi:hypothetical protein
MNSMKPNVQKYFVIAVLLTVPAFAWGQKKNNPPAPAPKAAPAAAPHASAPAPAQHSNAPTQHSNGPQTAGPNNHGGNNMGRPNTTAPGHAGAAANGRPGAANGRPTGNAMGARTNAGANAMGRPNAAGNGRVGANAASRVPPGRQVTLKGGGSASIRPNGQIRSVTRNGMTIQHGIHGGRTVVSTRNGARIVTTGRNGGYVQRAYFSRGGRTYVSRTYVVNNVTYTSVYRSYSYGGYCCYYGYAPAYYYHPVYYGWAYNPWPAPVYYGWGWNAAPWYGYYGPYYYQPYPVYPSAAFWLTDYLIAASLQSAYAAQMEANALLILDPNQDLPLVAGIGSIPAPEANKDVVLNKEVKDLLAEEVKAQLGDDQAAAGKSSGSSGGQAAAQTDSSAPLPALDPKRRTFVVHNELSVVADGDECSLTDGDVISRVSDTPDEDKNVDVKVLASKKSDCAVGKTVSVSLDDLQEMHNHFREQLTGGMDELSKKNGTGGLPKAPDTGKQDGEVPAPPADSSAAKALKDQQTSADQTESEVKQEAGSTGGGVQ